MFIQLDDLEKRIQEANSNDMYINIVRKYLFHGTPFVFSERENDYFDFREAIARHWGINFHDVLILGSAKLGYSYLKNINSH